MKSHNVKTLLLRRLLTHLQNGVIYLGLKKPVTPWIMLSNFFLFFFLFFYYLFTTQALLTKCYLTQLTVLTLLTTPYSLLFLHRKKKRKLQLQLLTTNNLN